MRLGWRIPLGGPFYLGGTLWRSRRKGYRHPGCPIHHTRPDMRDRCAARMGDNPRGEYSIRPAIPRPRKVRIQFFEEDDLTLSATVDEMDSLRATGADADELGKNLAVAMKKYLQDHPDMGGRLDDDVHDVVTTALARLRPGG